MYRGAQQGSSTYPYADGAPQPAPRRTSPFPHEQPLPPGSSSYPYGQQQPQQSPQPPRQQQPQAPQQQRVPTQGAQRNTAPRRVLGVIAFFVLTLLSMPVHIAAVFFVYVTFESPGDPTTAVLIVSGAFLGVFAALFVTGLVSQLVGGFPGRWRARVTFSVLSGVIALTAAYFAAMTLF